jgi:hypothetical protein
MNLDNWLKLIGIIGGLVAFAVGLWQYRRAQKWKRLEFVANEMKEFQSKRVIQNICWMLDWNEMKIEFHPEEKGGKDRFINVKDELIKEALSIKREKFSDEEIDIRHTFDEFFDCLEQFDHYIISGLVKYSEFHPYLAYWLCILTDKDSGRKKVSLIKAFEKFIDHFEYHGVQHLLDEYRKCAKKNRTAA